jgi:hypothetical protein
MKKILILAMFLLSISAQSVIGQKILPLGLRFEYEIKLMREGKLIRSAKFSVGTDGKLVNNNVGRELLSGTDILVPAQILGTIDGNYNKLAWKDGIFGNPISNLIVP